MSRYYAVKCGRETGVSTNVEWARAQTDNYPNQDYRVFAYEGDAYDYVAVRGIVYTDGSTRPNPGASGCGASLHIQARDGSYPAAWTDSKYLGYGTNNEAEYEGLILGLELALDKGVTHLIVRSDSQMMIRQMTREYQIRADNLIGLNNRVQNIANQFTTIKYEHVSRNDNTRADELANDAREQQDQQQYMSDDDY